MTLATLSHLNRWWIGELLNALLRPVWLGSPERGNSLRFLRLVNACDCWPFAVGRDYHQLWISDRPEDVDEWRDEYWGREDER